MIPLAAEKGLEFTIEDLAEYEADMHEECELDEGELSSVAGGKYDGVFVCIFLGAGHVDNKGGCCYVSGLSLGLCIWRGIQA